MTNSYSILNAKASIVILNANANNVILNVNANNVILNEVKDLIDIPYPILLPV